MHTTRAPTSSTLTLGVPVRLRRRRACSNAAREAASDCLYRPRREALARSDEFILRGDEGELVAAETGGQLDHRVNRGGGQRQRVAQALAAQQVGEEEGGGDVAA